MNELTRAGFEAWLKAKEPDDIVGNARVCSGCPLAAYLGETTHKRIAVLSKSYSTWSHYIDTQLLPHWAIDFIGLVDAGAQHVTAKTALSLLSKVIVE